MMERRETVLAVYCQHSAKLLGQGRHQLAPVYQTTCLQLYGRPWLVDLATCEHIGIDANTNDYIACIRWIAIKLQQDAGNLLSCRQQVIRPLEAEVDNPCLAQDAQDSQTDD
ncbi:hypothetical protein SAMN05216221_3242 [Pseudomonas oryzae]|uniref:Uncharacterized protein n=1 Tax=Pseudomonas oryzae TaxID=1392877 RepID=A0A1H1X093_9PSED|nr:hypothetical protein SAMN05216221_3242 [Pseudomonas oryzae]